ncbi:hypothetical protein COS74_03680 [bacterium CG06_land_8_20_14_3_00_33_50]|nr:MAG: hypothetical protein COU50_02055 [bacterium CG10_big_fil_rev_8_21_14_0_10_33_18]PIU76496.1 MAG: hypothetical protein COS74_03680 [bacterium CG06_land_8_20_14_3_00_33_50]
MKKNQSLILEEYIKGTEISVGVIEINNQLISLPPIEIIPKESEFFDYKSKYSGQNEEIVPARIEKQIENKAKELATTVHKLIKCKTISRTDMIIRKGEIFILEINTIPGMTQESLLPKEAKEFDISFEKLINLIIEKELKYGEKKGL